METDKLLNQKFILKKAKLVITIRDKTILKKTLKLWVNVYKSTCHFKYIKNTILKRSSKKCEHCRLSKIEKILYLNYRFIGTNDALKLIGVCNDCFNIMQKGVIYVIIQEYY